MRFDTRFACFATALILSALACKPTTIEPIGKGGGGTGGGGIGGGGGRDAAGEGSAGSSKGCGCRVGAGRQDEAGPTGLALVAVLLLMRRRIIYNLQSQI